MSIRHLQFDDSATISYSSLTTNYQNLLVMSDDYDVLFIFNATDAVIELSVPSGLQGSVLQYKNIRLPPYSTMAIDCRSNSKRLAKGTIQVRRTSTLPTTGEVTLTGVK